MLAVKRLSFKGLLGLATLASGAAALTSAPVWGKDWQELTTRLLQPVAVESQLPNSSTPMAMTTDAQGFLWVGTQNGLARWDGLQFRVFGTGTAAVTLPDSQIETLHLDHRGQLWVGMLSAGLARYDPISGSFRRYVAKAGGEAFSGVHAIADTQDGGLWVGAEKGLDRLTPATGVITHVQAPAQARIKLASGVNALASNRRELWIGTSKGLLHRNSQTGAITEVLLTSGAQPSIKSLLIDSAGRLWIGSEGAGAFMLTPSTGVARAIPGTLRAGLNGTGMRVRALLELSPHDVWLGTYDDGVMSVDPATLQSSRVRLGNGSLLYGDQNIRALYKAPGGQVFIAANSAITRYDLRHKAFETLMGGQAPTAVLAERTPNTLGQDNQGRLWIGFISHGLDIIDSRSGVVTHRGPTPDGLPEAVVRQLAPIGDGMLVGTDSGLYHARANDARVERLRQPGRARDAEVIALLRNGNHLWVGGRDGLWTYRLNSDNHLAPDQALPTRGLSDRRVQVLAQDGRGAVWIGTTRGLNVYHPRDRKLISLEPKPGDTTTPSGFISSINLDRRGRLWVTTFGHGVFVASSPEAAEA